MKRLLLIALAAIALFGVAPAHAQGGVFGSLDITETIETLDPDILISVNWRPDGSQRALAGVNSHKPVDRIVADLGRLELVPRPKAGRPIQIIGGAYSLKNTGDPLKDWTSFGDVVDGIGAIVRLAECGNGDKALGMWVRVKNGRREEVRWLFGRKVKYSARNFDDLFSFHVLSVRDGNGNFNPWHILPNGQIDYESIIATCLRYGSGIRPAIELSEGRYGRNGNGAPNGVNGNGMNGHSYPNGNGANGSPDAPVFVITSPVARAVRILWYNPDGSDGPVDEVNVEPGKESTVKVRPGFPTYDVYDRVGNESDWTRVLNRGKEEPFPTLTSGVRRMPFTR